MTRRQRLIAAVVVTAASRPLEAQTVRYEGGVSVTTGTYIFTERTTSLSLYTGVALNWGRITLRAGVPAYAQNTTLVSGSGTGWLPSGGSHHGTVADSAARPGGGGPGGSRRRVDLPASAVTGYESALGDPTLHVRGTLWDGRRTSLAAGAGVKIPLADTSGFGTGEWDAGLSVSLSQILGRSVVAGVDVAYWHLGDLPDLELRDPISAGVSLAYVGVGGWGATAAVSGARSAIAGFADVHALNAGITRLGSRALLSLTLTVGLSETAPDVAVGASWSVGIGSR